MAINTSQQEAVFAALVDAFSLRGVLPTKAAVDAALVEIRRRNPLFSDDVVDMMLKRGVVQAKRVESEQVYEVTLLGKNALRTFPRTVNVYRKVITEAVDNAATRRAQ